MTPALAADLFRSALWTALQAGAPLLGSLTIVAVVFGILQAATQIQDAAVSFTPKLIAALLVSWLSAAWFAALLSGFMHKALSAIPWVVAR
jgi:flagellar biosynthesis protein FliQ